MKGKKAILGMGSVITDFVSLIAIVLILIVAIIAFSVTFKGCGNDRITQTISSNITAETELDYKLMSFLRTSVPEEGYVHDYIARNYEKKKLEKLDAITKAVFNKLEYCEENKYDKKFEEGTLLIAGYSIVISEKKYLLVSADGLPKDLSFTSDHYEKSLDVYNSVATLPLKDGKIIYVRLGQSKVNAGGMKHCVEVNNKNKLE